MWNEATEFRLTKPELAVLVFTVKDLDTVSTDFIGWHVIPFTSLKPGNIYRGHCFEKKSFVNLKSI